MKRFVAAVIIFVIALTSAIGSNVLVKKRIEVLTDDTQALIKAVVTKDEDTVREKLKVLIESWEKSDTILHMFVVHREMTEFELNVYAIEEYLNGGDWELIRECSVRMQEALTHIQHSQKLSLRNVF